MAMATGFHLFGAAHLSILAAIVLAAAVLAVLQRRLRKGARWLRVGMGAILWTYAAKFIGG